MNGSENEERLEEFHPEPGTCYTLETVVSMTGVSRGSILVYCRSGLVRTRAEADEEGMAFDDEAVYAIRQIEYLRETQGVNLAGIRVIFELMAELRRVQEEMRFLRP